MRREIAMSQRHYPGWAFFLAASIAGLSMPSCAGTQPQRETSARDRAIHTGAQRMLAEIYASQKPVRFEQLDVAPIVLKHLPLGTDKTTVEASFRSLDTAKIIEDTPSRLVVRDNRGQAMLDPDARSVVMTFSFDLSGKLSKVEALHLKNQ
jgi:Family of unknown function (DUF6393)